MPCFYLQVRQAIALMGILVAIASSAQLAHAQYTWVQDTDNSGMWADPAMWTGGTPSTYPNGVGVTATINAPTRTGGSGNYNLTMPASDVTVGSLTVDNTNHSNSFRSNFTNGGDEFRLIFENTSGPATYTETIGSAPGAVNSQYQFLGKVRLNSDLVIDQENYPNLNTGTTFANLVEGASDRTITKDGHGGIQFNYNHFPTETPFQGQVVINQGGIRVISVNPFINVAGITVNSGGQLMLADNANNNANTNWNLASGAVLNLNGAGKATDSPQTVINPEGALRITLAQITSTSFDNPVVLQSDSVISVSVPALTATLAETVSGPGGLTKHGTGTLILGNASNSYSGDTTILAGGPLSITSPFLSDAADVHLTTGSIFDLNFSGSDTIRSLFVDGVPQAPGTYGAVDFGGLLITGSGTLTVSALPPGLAGDYNEDGVVDAADYVVWRKNVGAPTLPNRGDGVSGDVGEADYDVWRARFGDSLANGAGRGASSAAVPEPNGAVLASLAVCWMLKTRAARRRRV
jgi:autotransporter-associated beta strand protein